MIVYRELSVAKVLRCHAAASPEGENCWRIFQGWVFRGGAFGRAVLNGI